MFVDTNKSGSYDTGEPEIISRELPTTVDYYNCTFLSNSFGYESLGMASGDYDDGNYAIYLTNTQNERKGIKTFPTGVTYVVP